MNVKPTALSLVALSVLLASSANATNFEGPDSVENIIAQQKKRTERLANSVNR